MASVRGESRPAGYAWSGWTATATNVELYSAGERNTYDLAFSPDGMPLVLIPTWNGTGAPRGIVQRVPAPHGSRRRPGLPRRQRQVA